MRDVICRLLVSSDPMQTEKLLAAAVIYGKGEVTEVGRRRMSFSVLSTHIKHYLKWRYKTIEANRVIQYKDYKLMDSSSLA